VSDRTFGANKPARNSSIAASLRSASLMLLAKYPFH
jgi:hypothetical protein